MQLDISIPDLAVAEDAAGQQSSQELGELGAARGPVSDPTALIPCRACFADQTSLPEPWRGFFSGVQLI